MSKRQVHPASDLQPLLYEPRTRLTLSSPACSAYSSVCSWSLLCRRQSFASSAELIRLRFSQPLNSNSGADGVFSRDRMQKTSRYEVIVRHPNNFADHSHRDCPP
jgi:hypothetical protein